MRVVLSVLDNNRPRVRIKMSSRLAGRPSSTGDQAHDRGVGPIHRSTRSWPHRLRETYCTSTLSDLRHFSCMRRILLHS